MNQNQNIPSADLTLFKVMSTPIFRPRLKIKDKNYKLHYTGIKSMLLWELDSFIILFTLISPYPILWLYNQFDFSMTFINLYVVLLILLNIGLFYYCGKIRIWMIENNHMRIEEQPE